MEIETLIGLLDEYAAVAAEYGPASPEAVAVRYAALEGLALAMLGEYREGARSAVRGIAAVAEAHAALAAEDRVCIVDACGVTVAPTVREPCADRCANDAGVPS